jgi:hypothetical protein
MEIFRFNILPLKDLERREAFKEAVNNCPLCHEALQFQHEADYLYNSVKENAFCNHCKLQIREEDHKVQ